MPTLQVIASRPLAGKSAVAAGLALGFARAGMRVRLVRSGEDEAAALDAASFAELLFASSSGTPVPARLITPSPGDEVTAVECGAGTALPETPAVLVVRAGAGEHDLALVRPLGEQLLGTIATWVDPGRTEAVARDLTDAGLRPLALLPEDAVLAAPSVGEIRDALGARLLYDGENQDEVVEEVLIGPVYADPARPHFQRYASKAVLAPFNKTDLLLAAIETGAACVVVTGGGRLSPYVLDRAQGESTTLLLTDTETPQAVSSLAEVWLSSRFRGERKAQAVLDRLIPRLDFTALARRLGA